MAVLFLIDIVLNLWSAIGFIKVITAIVIGVLVLILVVLIVALIHKKRLNKTVLLRLIRGVFFPIQ